MGARGKRLQEHQMRAPERRQPASQVGTQGRWKPEPQMEAWGRRQQEPQMRAREWWQPDTQVGTQRRRQPEH